VNKKGIRKKEKRKGNEINKPRKLRKEENRRQEETFGQRNK
jgi:hypothetical protein